MQCNATHCTVIHTRNAIPYKQCYELLFFKVYFISQFKPWTFAIQQDYSNCTAWSNGKCNPQKSALQYTALQCIALKCNVLQCCALQCRELGGEREKTGMPPWATGAGQETRAGSSARLFLIPTFLARSVSRFRIIFFY